MFIHEIAVYVSIITIRRGKLNDTKDFEVDAKSFDNEHNCVPCKNVIFLFPRRNLNTVSDFICGFDMLFARELA